MDEFLENAEALRQLTNDVLLKELTTYAAFAKWVADEIFDEEWENNKDSFVEIACRKLEKLGIVKANGNVWEKSE